MTQKVEDTGNSNPQEEDQDSDNETMEIEQLTTTINTQKQPNTSIHSIPRNTATITGPRDRSPMMSLQRKIRKDLTGKKILAPIHPDRHIKEQEEETRAIRNIRQNRRIRKICHPIKIHTISDCFISLLAVYYIRRNIIVLM